MWPPIVSGTLRFQKFTLGLLLFSAVSALWGGVELMASRQGNPYLPPLELLNHTPFSNYFFPGLILAGAVGGSSLLGAILVWIHSRAALLATALAGGVLTGWIAVEMILIGEVHWLHFLYGGLGLVLWGLAVLSLGEDRGEVDRISQ